MGAVGPEGEAEGPPPLFLGRPCIFRCPRARWDRWWNFFRFLNFLAALRSTFGDSFEFVDRRSVSTRCARLLLGSFHASRSFGSEVCWTEAAPPAGLRLTARAQIVRALKAHVSMGNFFAARARVRNACC